MSDELIVREEKSSSPEREGGHAEPEEGLTKNIPSDFYRMTASIGSQP
jgi:hypothetical protein